MNFPEEFCCLDSRREFWDGFRKLEFLEVAVPESKIPALLLSFGIIRDWAGSIAHGLDKRIDE